MIPTDNCLVSGCSGVGQPLTKYFSLSCVPDFLGNGLNLLRNVQTCVLKTKNLLCKKAIKLLCSPKETIWHLNLHFSRIEDSLNSILQRNLHQNHIMPSWASVNIGFFGGLNSRNLVGDLALHHSEIEARLQDITVFALVDCNAAFIVVSGEHKSLCPFFMSKDIAEAYHGRLTADAPDMANKTRIVAIGLDRYFKYVTSEVNEGDDMKAVVFRIIPDPKEVENALRVIRTSRGIGYQACTSLEGVPLFQAASLEIKPTFGAIRATPFFLTKDDAYLAVLSGLSHKENLAVASEQKVSTDLQMAANLNNKKPESKYHNQIDRVLNRPQEIQDRQEEADNTSHDLKLEVGCLEWVIQQMEEDITGEWSEVVFIPPGFIRAMHEEKAIHNNRAHAPRDTL